MSTFLFYELPEGFEEMDVETAVKNTGWAFEEDEAKAKKIALELELAWPALWASKARVGFRRVYDSELKDVQYQEYAINFIRREIELRKNPPKISGCGCGILGQGCGKSECGCGQSNSGCGRAELGCGPTCKCGK